MSSIDISYHINNLNLTIVYIYKYFIPVIYVFGNIGNITSILIFSKKSWRKNVCVLYFKTCLFWNSCWINTAMFFLIFSIGYEINLLNSNIIICKMLMYLTFLAATLSPTIRILASIDRLLISSQNVDTRLYSSRRLAYFSISIGTIFWAIFNSHILIKTNLQEIYPSYFICYYDSDRFYLYFIPYSTAIFNTTFFLLMIVLCALAFKNVRQLRVVPREKRNQIRSMTKKDFQLLRCLFVQDIIYITFSIWIIIFYVYDAVTLDYVRTPLEHAIYSFVNNFVNFLYNIPYVSNFCVFIIISKSFRHELKRTICKIIDRDLAPMGEDENRQ
ncbi:hypothetical protein I4U23_015889 [Adineta vaga]|nr:hypothetical protein I4U23_015889 [Adineta vaga]